MGIFRRKSLEETRKETYTTIFDIVKKMDYVYEKASKEKFKEYIKKLQEEFQFSINNNKKINVKYENKIFKELDKIQDLLNHEMWNSRKIKNKLRMIEEIKQDIL